MEKKMTKKVFYLIAEKTDWTDFVFDDKRGFG
jgi:hypothetical protein